MPISLSSVAIASALVLLTACSHQVTAPALPMPAPFSAQLTWATEVTSVPWEFSALEVGGAEVSAQGEKLLLQAKRWPMDASGRNSFREAEAVLRRYLSRQRDPYGGGGSEVNGACLAPEKDERHGQQIRLGAYGFSAFTCSDPHPPYHAIVLFLECAESESYFLLNFLIPPGYADPKGLIASCRAEH